MREAQECVYLRPDPENEQEVVGEYAGINGFKLTGSPSCRTYISTVQTLVSAILRRLVEWNSGITL